MDQYCERKKRKRPQYKKKYTGPKKTRNTRLDDFYEVRMTRNKVIRKPRHEHHLRQKTLQECSGVRKRKKRFERKKKINTQVFSKKERQWKT